MHGTGGVSGLSRRPTWDVLRCRVFIVPPRRRLLLFVRGHRGIERAEDARAHVGREPPVQHHGAVILVPEGQAPVLVLRVGSLGLFRALRPAIQAHELLHVLGGAVEPDVQQVGFVLGSGNACECPGLGVAELALRERIGEQRQLPQRSGDADLLARGVGVDAAGPGEPVGARQRPLRGPDLTAVELGDENEEAVRGGVDVGGEGGDGGGKGVVVHRGEIVRRKGMQDGHGF